ncbi:hypothetical protein Trydic_g21878 [Trypoxylus dichotomus]
MTECSPTPRAPHVIAVSCLEAFGDYDDESHDALRGACGIDVSRSPRSRNDGLFCRIMEVAWAKVKAKARARRGGATSTQIER